jgi:hypothetical protein
MHVVGNAQTATLNYRTEKKLNKIKLMKVLVFLCFFLAGWSANANDAFSNHNAFEN